MNRSNLFSFIGLLLLIPSCAGEEEIPVLEAPLSEVCVLNNPDGEPLGDILSIDFVDDTSFVVSTSTQVYLYSSSGSMIRRIGRQGRAQSEYVYPFIVRADSGRIYVHDAMQLKFLIYAVDGSPVGEVEFPSATSDFLVDGNLIWLYTRSADPLSCIVSLDAESGEADVKDFLHYDGAHYLMDCFMSRAPIAMVDGALWCMPRSRLEIYRSDSPSVISIKSKSFKAQAVTNVDDIRNDKDKRFDYMCSNSMAVSILPVNDKLLVLTYEGCAVFDGKTADTSHRFHSVYSVDIAGGQSECIARIPCGLFRMYHLMCGPDCFYCLCNHIEGGEDHYVLNKIVLP